MAILQTKNLSKSYKNGQHELTVLDNVSIEIEESSVVAIVGHSGSGKTTLLGLCAGLDQASKGQVFIEGNDITNLNEDQRSRLRAESVGFIFQNFQLMPSLTAIENVVIPAELQGIKPKKSIARAKELLERVGLKERLNHYPTQLSGGEQQRVAIARAFIHNPRILFADEPTGNLDEQSSLLVESMLFELNKDSGTTLVAVTHDLDLARKASVQFKLKGGKLVSNKSRC